LLDTLVAHSGKTLTLNTLKQTCKTLLLDTLVGHSCLTHLEHLAVLLCTTQRPQSTSQYYFIPQFLHRVIPSTSLYCKSCTRPQGTSQYYFVLQSLHKAQGTSQYYFALQAPHSTLNSPHITLHTSHSSQSVAFGSQQQINEPGTLEVFGEYLFEQIYRMITG
jgi:hypothetical protein